jgi:L-aspartate oxidase
MTWEATADLVVVGSGVAGLTAAVEAQRLGLRVLVVTKGAADDGNTRWAQGGVAVAMPGEANQRDSIRRHIDDTLVAGAGLCDEDAVTTILVDGPAAVARLRHEGAVFDAGPDGRLARTREGGHTAFRVIHAGGDATGAEVERALLATARTQEVAVLERTVALQLMLTASGACAGLVVLDESGTGMLRAPAVLLATGGLGQLYQATSNPDVATADGIALALRAGAEVADLEFVQFHPTVLFTSADAQGRRPLVTEAVRGEGAFLVDGAGARVMEGVHPLADLAPRDVVSAAITRRLLEAPGGVDDHVFLDATHLSRTRFQERFPTVFAACAAAGIDPSADPIPVAPAAHFGCGGVVASVDGRTTVTGLYAAGEVARTGLHGANRLASNSLLEGLVVGGRAARAVAADLATGALADPRRAEAQRWPVVPIADRPALQQAMSRYAAIGRDAVGLGEIGSVVDKTSAIGALRTRRDVEDAALAVTARVLALAATEREESRGCHVRHDFPARDDARWRTTIAIRADESGAPHIVSRYELAGVA